MLYPVTHPVFWMAHKKRRSTADAVNFDVITVGALLRQRGAAGELHDHAQAAQAQIP
jgi:hypothetical protein